jgi:hypothetical protein
MFFDVLRSIVWIFPIPLVDTQALVISLAKSLLEYQGYTLYLDNLFTNVPLANVLGELGIGVMGTT